MKTSVVLLALETGLLLGACASPPTPAPGVKVDVSFRAPEKFTDVKTAFGTDAARDATLAELREHVERIAAPKLPANSTLQVTFTDIDRAGELEPWRGPSADDTRFVRPIYPPRIDLEFRLTDAAGAVLKEGRRELSDINFQMHASTFSSSDELRYEKALLTDWVREEFRR